MFFAKKCKLQTSIAFRSYNLGLKYVVGVTSGIFKAYCAGQVCAPTRHKVTEFMVENEPKIPENTEFNFETLCHLGAHTGAAFSKPHGRSLSPLSVMTLYLEALDKF